MVKRKRPVQIWFQVIKTDAQAGRNIKIRRLFKTEDEANRFALENIQLQTNILFGRYTFTTENSL